MSDLPILSLARLGEDCSPDGQLESRRLLETCRDKGFFYLRDHDVPPELLTRAFLASQTFFALPTAVKEAYGHQVQVVVPRTSRGYVGFGSETLDPRVGPDRKELFDQGFEQVKSDLPFTGPTVMPDDAIAPDFVAASRALRERVMSTVVPRLLAAFARALGQAPTWLLDVHSRPILIQRALSYPAETQGEPSFAGKHTDSGTFTLLWQEDAPMSSLQVHTGGEWIDVPPLPGTVVVNLGDTLHYWTDGLFVSTPHQVIHRAPHTRASLAFFVYPNIETRFTSLYEGNEYAVKDILSANFDSIWVKGEGAGRARELS